MVGRPGYVDRWLLPAAAGVAAAVLGVGAGELTAAVLDANASPVAAVGAALIDLSPPWAKETAIALFGTADKLVLILAICLLLAVAAGAAGVLEVRRTPLGSLLFVVGGIVGIAAAGTRATSSPLSVLPSAVATVV